MRVKRVTFLTRQKPLDLVYTPILQLVPLCSDCRISLSVTTMKSFVPLILTIFLFILHANAYIKVESQMTYDDAEAFCLATHSSHLATITSQDDSDAAAEECAAHGNDSQKRVSQSQPTIMAR